MFDLNNFNSNLTCTQKPWQPKRTQRRRKVVPPSLRPRIAPPLRFKSHFPIMFFFFVSRYKFRPSSGSSFQPHARYSRSCAQRRRVSHPQNMLSNLQSDRMEAVIFIIIILMVPYHLVYIYIQQNKPYAIRY